MERLVLLIRLSYHDQLKKNQSLLSYDICVFLSLFDERDRFNLSVYSIPSIRGVSEAISVSVAPLHASELLRHRSAVSAAGESASGGDGFKSVRTTNNGGPLRPSVQGRLQPFTLIAVQRTCCMQESKPIAGIAAAICRLLYFV